MADLYDTLEFQLLESVHTPDYPGTRYQDATPGTDLRTLVDSVPSRYLKLDGDTVVEMSQAEKDAVDLARLTAQRDAAVARLQNVEDVLRAFMLMVLDDRNAQAQATNSILAAAENATSLATFQSAMNAIADVPEYTEQQLRTGIRNKLGS